MFALSPAQIAIVLSEARNAQVFELREKGCKELAGVFSPHEIAVLADQGIVDGMSTRRGLKYFVLKVDTKIAMRLLRKSIAKASRMVAEDCQTTTRTTFAGGGVVFSHRGDFHRVWGRRPHFNNWGAEGCGPRAVVVVPKGRPRAKRRAKVAVGG